MKEEEAVLVEVQILLHHLAICWHCLTQRGFEGQWFADNLILDSHASDSETSYTVASLAAALHLRDEDKKKFQLQSYKEEAEHAHHPYVVTNQKLSNIGFHIW